MAEWRMVQLQWLMWARGGGTVQIGKVWAIPGGRLRPSHSREWGSMWSGCKASAREVLQQIWLPAHVDGWNLVHG